MQIIFDKIVTFNKNFMLSTYIKQAGHFSCRTVLVAHAKLSVHQYPQVIFWQAAI